MDDRCLRLAPLLVFALAIPTTVRADEPPPAPAAESLTAESLTGAGVWIDPALQGIANAERMVSVKVWFDQQLLGDGAAYQRRAGELRGWSRRALRIAAVERLKALNAAALADAEETLQALQDDGAVAAVQPFWIVNGFGCRIRAGDVSRLGTVPGVRKIFLMRPSGGRQAPSSTAAGIAHTKPDASPFEPDAYLHPWYTRYLGADLVWREFGITGEGTLNIIHDFNFVYAEHVNQNLYHNPREVADGEDNDGNGLVDDLHGYDFDRDRANLTISAVRPNADSPQGMHAYLCAAIICGTGTDSTRYEMGLAPRSEWAGVIAGRSLEAAVQWAIEQGADTYSMSFSIPQLAEYRSHWRKIMEHGALCGIYFVSGAGNFAQNVPQPRQMRTPEDIPAVVFAAAGVQRNLSRTPFSSQGPVLWDTQHYQDGEVIKPEVCAFNMGLPLLRLDGRLGNTQINGNSFAGPMFCGTIALMLSADPDLLPWELAEIITSTATDIGPEGVDVQTGHGLINAYRAVKEVLRRKAIRDGEDATPFTGRSEGDTLDVAGHAERLGEPQARVVQVNPNGMAAAAGLEVGDVIRTFNDRPLRNLNQFVRAAANRQPITLGIQRGDQTLDKTIAAGAWGMRVGFGFAEPVFE